MRRPLVLGIGNPLRGDDGFGAAVIEELQRAGFGAHADLLAVHQLTPELVLDLEGACCVAFVDASVELAAGQAGESDPRSTAPARSSWSHGLDPSGLLALGREVLGTELPARVFAVGAVGFDEGDDLASPLREHAPAIARRIVSWWEEFAD